MSLVSILRAQFNHEARMFPVLALIFIAVPVVEIFLLIQVGQVIGAWWTIGLVILTAIIGVRLPQNTGHIDLDARAGKDAVRKYACTGNA